MAGVHLQCRVFLQGNLNDLWQHLLIFFTVPAGFAFWNRAGRA
jgi:hypothetical protein